MSKIRIFIEPQSIGDLVEITDKNIVHKISNVLRLKEKDSIYVFDGEGREYLYEIQRMEKKYFIIKKRKKGRDEPPPLVKLILGFPLIREEKVDFILQKATELGVDGFIPFICSRSLRVKPSESKVKRWRKIVIEAVRQSGRLWIPEVYSVLDFEEVIQQRFSLKLSASIEGENLQKVLNKRIKDILVVVGPEGDFSLKEQEELKVRGFKFIRLSDNILRTETAAMFATGAIKLWLANSD